MKKKTTLREEEVVMAEFVYKPTATAKAPETTRHQKFQTATANHHNKLDPGT